MVLRKVLIFAALCALAALSAVSAFANPVWREGSATGPLVPVGAVLTSDLAPGTTYDWNVSGVGTIKCSTGTFAERVTSNASGGSAATATVTAFNFGQPAPASPCSGSVWSWQFQTIALANSPTLTQTSTTAVSETQTTWTYNLVGGGTCTFSSGASFTGATSNTDNSLAFTNVAVSGSFPCGNANFTVKFSPLVLQGTTTKVFTAAS